MPRVKLQRPTEAERLAAIAAETSLIIRLAMVRQDIAYIIDLADMIGMANATLCSKLKTGSWTQKDLCRLIPVLKLSSEDALKMLGVAK